MNSFTAISGCRRRRRQGQTLAEYALLIALVAVVAIAVLMNMGQTVGSTFLTVSAQLNSAKTAGVSTGQSGTRGGG